MRIVTKERAENFTEERLEIGRYAESFDQMMGGRQYQETKRYRFVFEDEEELENGGYAYDLKIYDPNIPDYLGGDNELFSEEKKFLQKIDFIASKLMKYGITLLSPRVYIKAPVVFDRTTERNVIEIDLTRSMYIADNETDVISYQELLDEINSPSIQEEIARAICARALLEKTYNISLESIPRREVVKISLERKRLSELMEEKNISKDEVIAVLKKFIEAADASGSYYLLPISGLEEIIAGMGEALKREVLLHSSVNSSNVQFFREHCIEAINYHRLKEDDLIPSDLDEIIKRKIRISRRNSRDLWDFVAHQMENSEEAERKVVDNIYTLLGCDLSAFLDLLHVLSMDDVLKSILKNDSVSIASLDPFLAIGRYDVEKSQSLDVTDFENCCRIIEQRQARDLDSKDDISSMISFTIKLGFKVGVDHERIASFIKKQSELTGEDVSAFGNKSDYEKFGFKLGLKWKEEYEKATEIRMRKEEEERRASNERVVEFTLKSEKILTQVKKQHRGAYKLYSLEDIYTMEPKQYIGGLLEEESRVILIGGGFINSYIMNVDRVKRIRNGVLYVDVAKKDAGYFIGTKGENVKALTARLNKMGCNIRTIRVNTY